MGLRPGDALRAKVLNQDEHSMLLSVASKAPMSGSLGRLQIFMIETCSMPGRIIGTLGVRF